MSRAHCFRNERERGMGRYLVPKNDRDSSECVWRYKGVASESFLSKGNGAGKGGGMETANLFP